MLRSTCFVLASANSLARPKARMKPVLTVAILVLCAGSLAAQTLEPCSDTAPFWTAFRIADGNATDTYGPFTMTVRVTFDRTLPDGTIIHSTGTSIAARDVNGRTLTASPEGCSPDPEEIPTLRVRHEIHDPATQRQTSWETGPGSPELVTVSVPVPLERPTDVAYTPKGTIHPYDRRRDSLGTAVIAGITVEGTRDTLIIQQGKNGNSKAMQQISETWLIPGTRIALKRVMQTTDGSRTVDEVISMTKSPPDPQLFAPPTDYKWVEISPGTRKFVDPPPSANAATRMPNP